MVIDQDCELLGRMPGLPDEVFDHDGLITKQAARASALAHLRPRPGELLWDLGLGAGSVAIEWCRGALGARAIGVERDPVRASRARANARRLTVDGALTVISGKVEEVSATLPAPDAIFFGGGASLASLESAVASLGPGGRLVVHGITLEAEELCAMAVRRWGGKLSRMQVEVLSPLGALLGWQPARTLTQWSYLRDSANMAAT